MMNIVHYIIIIHNNHLTVFFLISIEQYCHYCGQHQHRLVLAQSLELQGVEWGGGIVFFCKFFLRGVLWIVRKSGIPYFHFFNASFSKLFQVYPPSSLCASVGVAQLIFLDLSRWGNLRAPKLTEITPLLHTNNATYFRAILSFRSPIT